MPHYRVTSLVAALACAATAAPSFTIVGDAFQRDGVNTTLISAEIHYWRVVPGDWAARLAALRQAGFNAVTTYVLWSLHEPQPGAFDWAPAGGDLVAWVRSIQAAGLLAIVRVGPYITAEVDWGGLPFWLATVPTMRLRTNDTVWLRYVDRYLDALMPLLLPLQYSAGGPIVSFQVEDDTDTLIPAAETQVCELRVAHRRHAPSHAPLDPRAPIPSVHASPDRRTTRTS